MVARNRCIKSGDYIVPFFQIKKGRISTDFHMCAFTSLLSQLNVFKNIFLCFVESSFIGSFDVTSQLKYMNTDRLIVCNTCKIRNTMSREIIFFIIKVFFFHFFCLAAAHKFYQSPRTCASEQTLILCQFSLVLDECFFSHPALKSKAGWVEYIIYLRRKK